MSRKICCDGCGDEIGIENQITQFLDPIDKAKGSDGIRRSLTIRLGGNAVDMDLCVACHKRARSWIAEAFPRMGGTRTPWWKDMTAHGEVCSDDER